MALVCTLDQRLADSTNNATANRSDTPLEVVEGHWRHKEWLGWGLRIRRKKGTSPGMVVIENRS